MKDLSANHPGVYQDFIRSFIPESPKTSSQVMIATQMITHGPQGADLYNLHQGAVESNSQQGSGYSDISADEEDGELGFSDTDSSLDDDPIAGVGTS